MSSLQAKFEAIYQKYLNKKDFFRKVVDKWGKKRSYAKWHTQGVELLSFLDKESAEIKKMLSGAIHDDAALAKRIKAYKKAYKELYNATKPEWQQWLEALIIAGGLALVIRSFIFGLYHVPSGSAEPTVLVGDRVWGNKLAYYFDSIKRGDLVIFDAQGFPYSSNPITKLWQQYIGMKVLFIGADGPINVVKRVIAIPGDIIEGRVEDGRPVIYLNGQKLNEPYINPYPLIRLRKYAGVLPFKSIGPINMPEFLTAGYRDSKYTYDPDKSLDDQPYYSMSRSEILQNVRGESIIPPYTPEYILEEDRKTIRCMDVFGPITLQPGQYWVMGDSRNNSADSRWFGPLDEANIQGRMSFIIYSVDSQEGLWLFELIKHPINFWTKAVRWNRFFKKPTPVTRVK